MKNNSITLTIIMNGTANYGEGLGNISSVQKIYRDKKTYTIRTKESLKNHIMNQSGFYDDLETTLDKVVQKRIDSDFNLAMCRCLEGGYMSTAGKDSKNDKTRKRNSSFYVTDAISVEPFVNDTRFHNNLGLAENYQIKNNIEDIGKCGLNPFQYEHENNLRIYSITIDLNKIGVDANFDVDVDDSEKTDRVICLLEAVQSLSLVVKGNLDNAEPLFVIGGLSKRTTHAFQNIVKVEENKIVLHDDLINRVNSTPGYNVGIMSGIFENQDDVKTKINAVSVDEFFEQLKNSIYEHFND